MLLGLCYTSLRMPNEQDTTLQEMDRKKECLMGITTKERKSSHFSEQLLRNMCEGGRFGNLATDVTFIFLYHMARGMCVDTLLITTTMFFWEVTAFPVNCTASQIDIRQDKGLRKSRQEVSLASYNFNRGNCIKT